MASVAFCAPISLCLLLSHGEPSGNSRPCSFLGWRKPLQFILLPGPFNLGLRRPIWVVGGAEPLGSLGSSSACFQYCFLSSSTSSCYSAFASSSSSSQGSAECRSGAGKRMKAAPQPSKRNSRWILFYPALRISESYLSHDMGRKSHTPSLIVQSNMNLASVNGPTQSLAGSHS